MRLTTAAPRLTVLAATLAASLAAPSASRAQSADWTAILAVRPNPSPYLADWQSDPTMVTLVVSYTGTVDIPFYLDGSIRRGGSTVVAGRSIGYEFVRPQQVVVTTRDGIWQSGSVTIDGALKDQLDRTGRIPEGDYQFCVVVRRGIPESGGDATLATVCEPFTITAPEPPSLVAPADGDTVVASYPSFAWTPVLAAPNVRVTYHLRVTEILPGQAPMEALNNVPQYEADLSTTTTLYPTDALELRDSTRYAWQVQALDDQGAALGERQGKSEVFVFVYHPPVRIAGPIVVAGADSSTRAEKYVGSFEWSGVEVKVLKVVDSSHAHYSGTGRLVLIKGVFEPKVGFHALHLTPDAKKVAYAPHHSFGYDTGPVVGYDGLLKRVFPVLLLPDHIDITADSASGDHHVGITGSIGVQLSGGAFTADSATRADSASDAAAAAAVKATYAAAQSDYERADAEWSARFDACKAKSALLYSDSTYTESFNTPADSVCFAELPSAPLAPNDPDTVNVVSDSVKAARSKAAAIRADERYLLFHFVDVHVSAGDFGGRLVLARTWKGKALGVPGLAVTLYADTTWLDVSHGVGTLNVKGDVTIPTSTGLYADVVHVDTVSKDTVARTVKTTRDSSIVLKIREAQFDTQGELYVAAAGIPRARIGGTGLRFETGNAWIDLSSTLSPSGRAASWQGIYLDSARVFLPDDWMQTGDSAATTSSSAATSATSGTTSGTTSGKAVKAASVVAYKLAIDGQGIDGDVYGSQLGRMGTVAYAGFSGRLDSLRFKFTRGTLDTGYVRGAVGVPFLARMVKYAVNFTPVGIGQAYAELDSQPIDMPAFHARAVLQRLRLDYVRPVGTVTLDGLLTLDQDGIALRRLQIYRLAIGSDGKVTLGNGWLVFDGPNEGAFKNFPVALDSIGLGTSADAQQVWLGVAGRFRLGDDLPASAATFRIFARRPSPDRDFEFQRLAVDKVDLEFRNGAVAFKGKLDYLDGDPVYGSAFKAAVAMTVNDQFQVSGNLLIGATSDSAAAAAAGGSFRYWYVDAKLLLPPPGIQLGTLPLALYGFGGGAYAHMTASIDTLTLKAKYVPDRNTAFGLKALVTVGSAASNGYVWNADATLEAAVAASGGLSSLTLRGDNWMLADVQHRVNRMWGTVFVNFPVSHPVLQANATLNVNIPPALKGAGWAELHFEPGKWHVYVGSKQRPDSLTIYPTTLRLASTAYFQMDPLGIDAGFGTFLTQSKKVGSFYGSVSAGFTAEAQMRYRPFLAMGDGELWGEIVAKVKGYTILDGTARATMAFQLPDPTKISGQVKLRYKLLNGALKGTYKMHYAWSSGAESATDTGTTSFVLVASTYPATGDTAAAVNGATYYLGMNEAAEYGLEDGSIHRLRLTSTPALQIGTPRTVIRPTTTTTTTATTSATSTTSATAGGRVAAPTRPISTTAVGGSTVTIAWSYASAGTPSVDFDGDRSALTVTGPAYAPFAPATRYRVIAPFTLEKLQSDGTWLAERSIADTLIFDTVRDTVTLAQLVATTDPQGGASPLYYAGPNKGIARVEFTNTVPALASGAVVGTVTPAGAADPVAGSWARQSAGTVYNGGIALSGSQPSIDPRLYRYAPTGGALAPATSYRLGLVTNDSTRTELYGVTFTTSRYASLSGHVGASTVTVTPTRGVGPVSGAGSYLRHLTVTLESAEAMSWGDITDVDVVGYPSAAVSTRTQCRPPSTGGGPLSLASGATTYTLIARYTTGSLCGSTPVFQNVIDIAFAAPADSSLPAATLPSVTLTLHHRREGAPSFTFAIPRAITTPVPIRRAP